MAAEASLYVGELNIAQLTDEELYQRLTDMGCAVGPIVDSTRKTYQRKLAVLMGADVADYSFTESIPGINEADDQDVEPTPAYLERLSSGDNYPRHRKPQQGSRSVVYDDEDEEEDMKTGEYGEAGGEQSYSSPSSLYTPSPRRPLHSPETSNTASSYRHQESYLSTPSTQSSVNKQQQQAAEERGGSGQLLFMILLVVIVLAVAYYFVAARLSEDNLPQKDAFASLEHLAKTAADALEKEQQQQQSHQEPRTGL